MGSDNEIETGTVRWFNRLKGFGFIMPDDENKPDVFVHRTEIRVEGFQSLADGERVEFRTEEDETSGQRKATGVIIPGLTADGNLPMTPSGQPHPRASATQIRRAAGGKNLALLEKLVETGWSASDLDSLASEDGGKGALHMSAWHGSLENIKFLLDVGCDINNIATGKYSYGKTAIFFAITRDRDDACMLLLEKGANVRIVNNKGQSVLSLALSHLQVDTTQAIQQAENAQTQYEWKNYQESHSDGANYGDLDRRFLSRPIFPEDDVTEFVVNPSTKQSRKGNFARLNPTLASREALARAKKPQRRKKPIATPPTASERKEHERSWEEIGISLKETDHKKFAGALLGIVRFGENRQQAWIPNASQRLRESIAAVQDFESLALAGLAFIKNSCSSREMMLLQKLVSAASKPEQAQNNTQGEFATGKSRSAPSTKACDLTKSISTPELQAALDSIACLSSSMFQNPSRNSRHLSLPSKPYWVETLQDLRRVQEVLINLAKQPGKCLVAFDTEWCTNPDGAISLATLQLASLVEKLPTAWVVDLKSDGGKDVQEGEYRSVVVDMISWFFHDSCCVILGFAIGHDISKLSTFVRKPILTANCIDVQSMVARKNVNCEKKNLPGLKACCAHYLSSSNHPESSSWELSKEEQCSDWARRPLSEKQLEYAGLDAGILLVLFKEAMA